MGPLELRVAEVGFLEVRFDEIGVAEVRLSCLRAPPPHLPQVRVLSAEAGMGEDRFEAPRAHQLGVRQIRRVEVGACEVRAFQNELREISPGQLGVREIELDRFERLGRAKSRFEDPHEELRHDLRVINLQVRDRHQPEGCVLGPKEG